MRTRRGHFKPANVLWGFMKAIPLILIPTAALLFETWLNLGILTFDYEEPALRAELDRANEHIEKMRVRIAELESMDRIDARARELDLVARKHEQLVVVNSWPAEKAWDASQGFDIANGRTRFTTGDSHP